MTRVEDALRALGMRLETEPVADVAADVAARLAVARPRTARRTARVRRRTLAFALAALLIAAGTALAASSAVRDQARAWLRAVGISTSVSERAGQAPVVSLANAGLGTRLSTGDAAARLGVRTLPHPFGPPDRAYSTAGAVTLAWPPQPALPPSVVRGVGALLTIEERTDATDPFLLGKVLSGASAVQFVPLPGVDGGQAVWIAGAPHAVRTFDGSRIRFRLAANALLWRIGARVYRLEGRFGRAAALAAARRVIG